MQRSVGARCDAGQIPAGEGELTQKPSFERECFITAAYASAQMR